MAMITRLILLGVIACVGLSACGHKGKQKTPSQVEKAEQKKQEQKAN